MSEQDSGQQGSETRDEAEEMARLQEQINNLPVGEHILYMMHSLSALAVDRLGLAPESAARRDVGQARLAIDAFRALLGVLEEARPTEEIAAHRGVLSQLQMAFVGALSGPETREAEEPEQGTEVKEPSGTVSEPPAEESVEAADEPASEVAAESAPEAKPRKAAPKKTSKPRSSKGAAAKKSGGSGAAKSTKKGS